MNAINKYTNYLSKHHVINIGTKTLFAINIGLSISFVGLLVLSIGRGLYWRADFTAFYTGGSIVRDSLGSELYNLELQKIYQSEILNGRSFKDGVLPFNYPPFVAILFFPLSYLSLEAAYYLWLSFQIILVIYIIIILINISVSWEPIERGYIIVVSLAIPYLLITLLLGTFSLLMLVGILQFYQSYKSGHYLRAGLWLSILALKPQILVVPIIIVLSSKQWRTLITSIIIVFIFFILTALLLGWNIWANFLERLTLSSTYFDNFGIYPSTMHNLKGILTSLFGGNQGNIINLFVITAFILMLFSIFILWWRSFEPTSSEFDLKFSLSLTLGTLFSPHVNPQDSLLLIAPLAIFLNFQNLLKLDRRYYLLFLLSFPLITLLSDFWVKDSLYIRPTIVMNILLAVWIIHTYFKMGKIPNQMS